MTYINHLVSYSEAFTRQQTRVQSLNNNISISTLVNNKITIRANLSWTVENVVNSDTTAVRVLLNIIILIGYAEIKYQFLHSFFTCSAVRQKISIA
jgi:hypothetical protein